MRRLGEQVIDPILREFTERHPSVGDVRGTGCFWVLELVSDRESRAMLNRAGGSSPNPMKDLERACFDGGVAVLVVENRLYICPPLIIGEEDLRAGLRVVDRALDVADDRTGAVS